VLKFQIFVGLTFVIETIDAVDTCTLMVATKDEEVLGVLDLVGEEQTDSLERLLSTIDIVAKEQVVCLWWEASIFEQSEQVVVLAVYVTYRHMDDMNKMVRTRL
jgi:hypothetical protein